MRLFLPFFARPADRRHPRLVVVREQYIQSAGAQLHLNLMPDSARVRNSLILHPLSWNRLFAHFSYSPSLLIRLMCVCEPGDPNMWSMGTLPFSLALACEPYLIPGGATTAMTDEVYNQAGKRHAVPVITSLTHIYTHSQCVRGKTRER